MPRRPDPWRRGGKDGPWYAQVGGVQHFLAPAEATKTEAIEALTLVLAESRKDARPKPGGLRFRDAVNLFLADLDGRVRRGERKALTAEGYHRFLPPAAAVLGRHPVSALKPHHVSAWLEGERWNSTTRNNAITHLKACLNWARKAGHVTENPLRDMEKPTPQVTEADLTPDDARAMIAAAKDRPFRDFMAVAFGTGARPSELMRLEARHLDLEAGVAVMEGKTSGRTNRPRVIQVASVASTLARLAELHPAGPVLRNGRGAPWTRNALATRFSRMRKALKLGKGATAKGFRHGFVTDGLEAGVPIATMAELAGHQSTKMIERHYSKLRLRNKHLADAAGKVRPGEGESGG